MKDINFNEILSLPECFHKQNIHFKNQVVLYGAGTFGSYCLKYLYQCNVKPVAVCDTFKAGHDFYGYNVCSINDVLSNFENPQIIITSLTYYDEIKNQLTQFFSEDAFVPIVEELRHQELNEYRIFIQNNRYKLNKIYNMFDDEKSKETFINILKLRITGNDDWAKKSYDKNQYFPEDIINLNDTECFVDGGAFVGDTSEIFIEKTKNKYNKIYCFEPSEHNYMRLFELSEKYKNEGKIVLFREGLYSDNLRLGFDDCSLSQSNAINEEYSGINCIDVVSIDKIINEDVTFIKMDIEGSELEALKGAKETIIKNKPKLAICVYHENQDLIDIPEFIMSLGLDYKYYLRHHDETNKYETVFYAV